MSVFHVQLRNDNRGCSSWDSLLLVRTREHSLLLSHEGGGLPRPTHTVTSTVHAGGLVGDGGGLTLERAVTRAESLWVAQLHARPLGLRGLEVSLLPAKARPETDLGRS